MTNPSDGHPTRRRAWRFWATTLAVFVSGLVIGAALSVVFMHQMRMRMFRNPEAIDQKLLADVKDAFQLDEAHVAAIAEVLQKRRKAFEDMRSEIRPRLEREIALLESQIADVLPTDKREAWHEYYKRFRLEWMPPLPPPPDHSGR